MYHCKRIFSRHALFNLPLIFYLIFVFNVPLSSQTGWPQDFLDMQFVDQNNGWVVGEEGKIAKTTNGGLSWIKINSQTIKKIKSVFFIDTNCGWFCGDGIVSKSTNGGSEWNTLINNDEYFESIFFIDSLNGWMVGSQLYTTIDGGNTWTTHYIAYGWFSNIQFLDLNTGWVAGTGIYKTSDGGNSWECQYEPSSITDIFFCNSQLGWVVGDNGFIRKTANGGITWLSVIAPSFQYSSIFFVDENTGWIVGHSPYHIMKTSDSGANWYLQAFYHYNRLYSCYFYNHTIGWVSGEDGIVSRTTDGGASWGSFFLPVELTSFVVNIFFDKVDLLWSTATEVNNHGFEIERSLDKTIWASIGFREGKGTTSEPQDYTYSDDISEISSSKLYYRLKQIDFNGSFEYSKIVEVEIAPTKFSLQQNYPNPFNPGTSIQFAISSLPTGQAGRQFVTLKVYDVLGKEIATLVNEEKSAGSYETEFNASHLASGIYFYQLRAGDYVETKKMILMK